jgi:hypothetical protein
MEIINISLLVLNIVFSYANYGLKNYKLAIFSAFSAGFILAVLIATFLNN